MKVLKSMMILAIVVMGVTVLTSCSKDKDNGDLPAGKTMKFTLNTTGLSAADDFNVHFTGATASGSTTTVFKINGVTQSNAIDITITNAQLRAGQVVIESVVPLYNVAAIATGHSAAAGHTFTFKMDAVVGGKTQPNVTRSIGTAAFTENFSFL